MSRAFLKEDSGDERLAQLAERFLS